MDFLLFGKWQNHPVQSERLPPKSQDADSIGAAK